jgi:Tfp pilus assembly protein PilO
MIKWIADNQDFILFSLMSIIAILGYWMGSMSKSDELQSLINEYENLLNLAYTDKQNLMVALASMQGRQEGQYLGYRITDPQIYNSACTCDFCQGMRNA